MNIRRFGLERVDLALQLTAAPYKQVRDQPTYTAPEVKNFNDHFKQVERIQHVCAKWLHIQKSCLWTLSKIRDSFGCYGSIMPSWLLGYHLQFPQWLVDEGLSV